MEFLGFVCKPPRNIDMKYSAHNARIVSSLDYPESICSFSTWFAISCYLFSTVKTNHSFFILLLLAGNVELNPGPSRLTFTYPIHPRIVVDDEPCLKHNGTSEKSCSSIYSQQTIITCKCRQKRVIISQVRILLLPHSYRLASLSGEGMREDRM